LSSKKGKVVFEKQLKISFLKKKSHPPHPRPSPGLPRKKHIDFRSHKKLCGVWMGIYGVFHAHPVRWVCVQEGYAFF